MKSGKLTVNDVARLAGVSPMTVSRTLNKPDQVSSATRERVMTVVEETGFVLNGLASGLRSSRARLIAAALPTLTGPVFQDMVRSMSMALNEAGYQLVIGETGYKDERESDLLDAIIRGRPDGIVLVGLMNSAAGRARLVAAGIPIVETWDLTADPIDMLVGFSHEEIGAAVFEYIHMKGYRRPYLLSANDRRALRRVEGFKRAAERSKTRVTTLFVDAPTTLAAGRSAMSEALAGRYRPDVVFCSSDLMALGAMIELQSRGISLPAEIGVIGLGDLDFAKSLNPPLTTVRVDGKQIGRLAAEMMVSRIEGPSAQGSTDSIVDVGFEIVERGST